MATPATSHVAPNFIPAFGESIELLRQVLFTSGQPFIIAGSGTLGWDMTASNLIEAGEDVLVCNSGYFGDRFGERYVSLSFSLSHCLGILRSLDDNFALEMVIHDVRRDHRQGGL